jgi:hypothetical protein
MSVRMFTLASVLATAAAFAPFATGVHAQSQRSWKCSAPGLQGSSYDGGATAYIHLSGFPSGGSYRVTRVTPPWA